MMLNQTTPMSGFKNFEQTESDQFVNKTMDIRILDTFQNL